MIGSIISFLILYLLVGFIAVMFSTPPKSCKKGDRRKLFFLIILVWPYCFVIIFIQLIKDIAKIWFK